VIYYHCSLRLRSRRRITILDGEDSKIPVWSPWPVTAARDYSAVRSIATKT